ncbi:LiaF transmembrane domain-containing protein [Melioribacter sp. OK-6-Me]|uniref:LiaF transmembrane domain-containing protein n=1 Tax=unclassified Melioribacter TaxID=2627329 RepID=UPI003ED979AA
MDNSKISKTNWLGIILIIAGALLLVDNIFMLDFSFRHIIFSWHTVSLIIGIVIHSKSKNSVAGIVFLVIGIFGIASKILHPFFVLRFRDFWPIIIIIIGLLIILKRNGHSNKHHHFEAAHTEESSKGFDYTENADYINEECVLTSSTKLIQSNNFSGGKINVILGSAQLNFDNSRLAEGEIVLNISCVMGGCTLFVPKNWKVISNLTSIFGGFDDKRYFIPDSEEMQEGLLILKGSVVFGGCEVYYS